MANELLHADDIVLMSETVKDFSKERVCNWKDALESMDLKVDIRKIKVASRSEGELFKSKTYQSGVCDRRLMADSVLRRKFGNRLHAGCAKIKKVTA